MKLAFLLIFIISSIIHLYGSYLNNKRIRNYSKSLILIGIMGFYVYSVDDINIILLLAVLFSWLGDVLLIPKGVKWFTIGGICFWISHFLFIFAYLPHINFGSVNWIIIAALFIIYFYFINREFKMLKPFLPKALFIPMYLYLMTNMSNSLFAVMMIFSTLKLGAVLVFIGAALFFVSDSLLFLVRFHVKDLVPKKHFYVMLAYIASEFLMVYGLMIL